ncbi:hypothetical protein CNR22_07850 [Sphingobacteriaceae bacterium]|nr:hypothetical protein CNR22_07850 [Sphingobacteriaceae bacterium]
MLNNTMSKIPQPQELFKNIDFSTEHSFRKEFEYCEFISCIFPDLSNLIFRDCIFRNCNFSNLKTHQSILQNCLYKDCKLLGVNFSGAKDFAFEIHFDNCNLDYSSFDKKKLNKSSFKNSKIHGANFTQADLSKCTVSNCDFYEALFSGTNLSGLDLSTSVNFTIDPELNKIKKAKFALRSLPGLLQRYEIQVEN